MNIDLGDRRVIAALIALVRKEIAAAFRERQPMTHDGIVFGPPDGNGKVAVRLYDQAEPHPGFAYGRVAPKDGDLVRVVIDPRGPRYIDEVLDREGLDAYFDVAADGTIAFHDRGDLTAGRLFIGDRSLGAFLQASPLQGVDAIWVEPGLYVPGPIIGNNLSATGIVDFAAATATFLASGILQTRHMTALAKRLRFVPIPQISVINAATTTADIGNTNTAEITGLPLTAYAAVGQIFLSTSDTSAADVTASHYSGDAAGHAWSPGVAGRIGAGTFIAVLGGTNNRQMKYAVNWVSGTVTYWLWLHGYLTLED